MIALILAAALAAADPPWIERREDVIGRPYHPAPTPPPVQLVVRIESPSANPRWDYRVQYWSREPGRGYYIEREFAAGYYAETMVNTRDCPALLPLLREIPRLRMAPFHIEGISPPVATPELTHWRYQIAGSAEHPAGQGGELSAQSWQVPGVEPDPIARWAQAFNRVYERCAGNQGRPRGE